MIDCSLEIDNWDDRELFFDNWFTCLPLVSVINKQGLRAACIIGTDRFRKDLTICKKISK